MAPTRPSVTGSAAQRGFTLTEMLVVLAIVGLLIAAIPVLLQSALPGTRSLAAARALGDDLRAARGAAIAGGHPTVIRLDSSRQVYVIAPGNRARRLPHAIPFALPQAKPAETIGFYPDGSSTGGEVLVGDGTQRHRVAVQWLTGRVAIDE